MEAARAEAAEAAQVQVQENVTDFLSTDFWGDGVLGGEVHGVKVCAENTAQVEAASKEASSQVDAELEAAAQVDAELEAATQNEAEQEDEMTEWEFEERRVLLDEMGCMDWDDRKMRLAQWFYRYRKQAGWLQFWQHYTQGSGFGRERKVVGATTEASFEAEAEAADWAAEMVWDVMVCLELLDEQGADLAEAAHAEAKTGALSGAQKEQIREQLRS